MKKKIIFFLLWILHFNCYSQWVELNVPNTNATYFSDVYAITPDIVIVIGNNGTILKTTDGGVTWQQKTSGTIKLLNKVHFSNANIGYIIGDQGTLLKTSDGGENWISIETGHSDNFKGLSSVDENLVYIVYEGNLLKSVNAGASWQNYPLDFSNGDIQFLTSEIGYSSKSGGWILKTLNGGEMWQDSAGLGTFHFITSNTGFCYDGGLKKTINGGGDFVWLGSGNAGQLLKIFAINENTVWGILYPLLNGDGTSPGTVKMTYNSQSGYNESFEYDDNETNMSSLYFSNDKLGYAVGNKNGKSTIWKNTTGNTLATNKYDFKDLINIYPNPASDKINIFINNQYSKEFTLNLTDMSGKIVFNHYYKNKKEVTIDVQKFHKGNYILTIKDGNQTYSQKIIIQ